MADPDKVFENFAEKLVPIWGPIYAMYYIIRYLIHELRKGKDS
jgi:hypothetical protein